MLDATRDGLGEPAPPAEHAQHFTRIVDHLRLPVGHDVPQEAPAPFAAAVARLRF